MTVQDDGLGATIDASRGFNKRGGCDATGRHRRRDGLVAVAP